MPVISPPSSHGTYFQDQIAGLLEITTIIITAAPLTACFSAQALAQHITVMIAATPSDRGYGYPHSSRMDLIFKVQVPGQRSPGGLWGRFLGCPARRGTDLHLRAALPGVLLATPCQARWIGDVWGRARINGHALIYLGASSSTWDALST